MRAGIQTHYLLNLVQIMWAFKRAYTLHFRLVQTYSTVKLLKLPREPNVRLPATVTRKDFS